MHADGVSHAHGPCNAGFILIGRHGNHFAGQSHDLTAMAKSFNSITFTVEGSIAHVRLNRPDHYNAIDQHMPVELQRAVRLANDDDRVGCIVLSGNGKGFCGGYDLNIYAANAERGSTEGSQDVSRGYDPLIDYKMMKACTDAYTTLFRSYKPTIAMVHGAAAAGGSDIALSCDLVVMADDARIGYPPSRVWGCPTTAMWAYRIGVEKAKRMLFTGDLIDGKEAERMGLILKAVPHSELKSAVMLLAERIASVPQNQLFMQKQVLNSLVETSLESSQRLATLFDGITRNSPEGLAFQRTAEQHGLKAAVKQRDSPGRTDEYRKTWKSVL